MASTGAQPLTIRTRVPRACDRCRVKKSKCDGHKPCAKCRNDNALCCVTALRTPKTVFPPGYTELVERQNKYLVSALITLYRRLLLGQSWDGAPVQEANGFPLVHDILERLEINTVDEGGRCIHPDGTVEQYQESPALVELVAQRDKSARVTGAPAPPRSIDSNTPAATTENNTQKNCEVVLDDTGSISLALPTGDGDDLVMMPTMDIEQLSATQDSPPCSPDSRSSCQEFPDLGETWWFDWVLQSGYSDFLSAVGPKSDATIERAQDVEEMEL